MNGSTARVGWMLAAPLLLVNSAASWGQAGWAHDHITAGIPGILAPWLIAVLFAVTVESIGVYLAGMAHAARMADQSAGALQLGSYLVGLLVGVLNYWHFAGPSFAPTAQAVVFGALSSVSPWLWAIYSRYRNRDRLAELGQVDKRGVKLSTSRKFWHPKKSISVIRFAAWEGIVEPDEAVRAWTAARRTEPVQALATVHPLPVPPIREEPDEEPEDEPAVDPWAAFSRRLEIVKPSDPWQDALDDLGRPANGRHWTRPEAQDGIHHTDAVDPVFQPPERPASDEDLVTRYGDQLLLLRAAGKLNRYQVEQLTGAGRRQAERIIDQINSETDQVATMVNGSKDVT